MKKTTIALAVAASIFGAGCAEPVSNDVKVTTKPQNILIAYYSYSGNTKFAAELIQKQTGGDLFEIVPETPYPSDYDACVSQARDEIRSGFKPQLKTQVENFDQYDTIFIGTPNWWSTMAPPVHSFIAGHDFSGKTVIPFVTHGGGGMADCEEDMQKAAVNAKFGKGGAFRGSNIRNSGEAVAKWVNEVISIKTEEVKQ